MKYLPLALLCSCGVFGSLTPAEQAKADRFECVVAAITPLVDPVLDAEETARELFKGKLDLSALVRTFQASQAEVELLLNRLNACGKAE